MDKNIFVDFLKDVWASLDIKKILLGFWYSSLKPALVKLVAKTDNPWDDYAVTALEYLIEKFLGSEEQAVKVKESLKNG